MKKVLPCIYAVLALMAYVAFSYFLSHHGQAGAALAMAVPLLPRGIFSHRPLIHRAIRLDDGTWGEGGEVLHYPVYDRLKMANSQGVNARSYFKTAVGQQREGTALTYADTNIEKSESIPSSLKWTFYRFTVSYMAIAARTDALIQSILSYMQTTTIRCIINSKDDMFRLPLWKFFGGTQLISAPAVTVNSRFPQALFSGAFDLKVPIVLQSLTDWELRVEPLTASAAGLDGDYIGFEFDGERARKD